jgi:heme-degrading monooxygenase HmoA
MERRHQTVLLQHHQEENGMIKLLVHHKVADYGKWREVFDSMKDVRQSFGMTGEQVLHVSGSPNEIVALTEWTDADQARAFATSSELRQGMQKAGVITQPEVLILEEAKNAQELTRQVLRAIEAQDWAGARALLSDDFQFSGAVPVPIGPDEWLGVHRALAAGMPDFSFHYQATGGVGDKAEGAVQVGGTHTGTFTPPIPGLPSVPPTGNKILNPQEPISVTAKDGKLTRYVVEHVPNAGLLGILGQMGVTLTHV